MYALQHKLNADGSDTFETDAEFLQSLSEVRKHTHCTYTTRLHQPVEKMANGDIDFLALHTIPFRSYFLCFIAMLLCLCFVQDKLEKALAVLVESTLEEAALLRFANTYVTDSLRFSDALMFVRALVLPRVPTRSQYLPRRHFHIRYKGKKARV